MLDLTKTPGYIPGIIFYVKCPRCGRKLQKSDPDPNTARITCDFCHHRFIAYSFIQEVEE